MLDHHAYLFRLEEVESVRISKIVEKFSFKEVETVIVENFGIGDSRSLIETAFKKPREGDQKLVVVAFKNITVEAAQALLKILEEPPKTIVFVFCVPKSLFLLPTLLSRFQEDQSYEVSVSENLPQSFIDFQTMDPGKRITEITNRLTAKDTGWVSEIKIGLIGLLSKKDASRKIKSAKVLLWIAKHLQTRGASNKQLLEELALTL